MTETNDTLPVTDDLSVDVNTGQSEQELLDAVLANSQFLEDEEVPLPDSHEPEDDPEESDEYEDPEESEDAVSDEEDEDYDEEAEDEDDEDSTQDADVYSPDDFDLEAQVSLKIDGEETNVSLGDLIKNYQTDASISNKGRELGEARKQLDEEKAQAFEQIKNVSEASSAILMQDEQKFAKQYHDLKAKVEKAREEGDTYEVSQLKDKLDVANEKYWGARRKRESLLQTVGQQRQALEQQEWNKKLETFSETITEFVPDFDEETATAIREFALKRGVSESFLSTVVDPAAVKLVNDLRLLEEKTTKGAAKRKSVPTKKAVPTKKPKSKTQKKQSQFNALKAKVESGNATKADQEAYAKMFALESLKNL